MRTTLWAFQGSQLFILLLALVIQACTQSPTVSRRTTLVQPATAPATETGNETQDDSEVSDEAGDDEALAEEENLPPYLFKLSEAQQIAELVEAYLPTDYDMFADATAAANREELRAYFQSFLGSMMAIPGLSPGRELDVMVSDSDVPNASAAGQQIMINEGMLAVANSKSLLGVICHEIAHSSKNHSQKSEADQVFAGLDGFLQSNEFVTYINAAYNGTTYTHNKADYDALRKTWDEVAKDPSVYSRRHESEADIVGGMLCAHLGMSADEFYQSQLQLRKALEAGQGAPQSANNLQDGTQIPIGQDEIQDFVTGFLFPLNSHPTGKERDSQLLRTKTAIQKYFDGNSMLYTDFNNRYTELTPAVGLVGSQPLKLPFWYKPRCSHKQHQLVVDIGSL
ncbi:M48 family metalloprotease [Pseudobacteriovorax antillogorgiicola]|uniref:Peptidase family M48 n=1 Tax=Pseudobacteriovorax antillogorgiicola TaxID=1513793 RepID=A0A1Y6CP77_9BACT|nr:M48 family metalloprotease [Pseudobacteriovorax antillogorgiicola]TCS44621.1 peptidase M48-like protein [Pseudobacteriovorax antillogorgiicola]SMF78373.1 Peptidase family M48 [Pseudobacteriovorax antillogorgiicola]